MLRMRQDGSRSTRNTVLAAALILAWAGVAGVLLTSQDEDPSPEPDPFLRSTGGLGLPASADPRWTLRSLDPRLEQVDPTGLRPVPGLIPFCPHETMGLRRAIEFDAWTIAVDDD